MPIRLHFFALFLLAPLALHAQWLERDHTKLRLISESHTASAMTIGVHFRLDPEWHIYWKNPGDSGAAPKFNLVNGQILNTLWPYPERIPVSELTNFGYSTEVVIFLELHNITENSILSLEWLVCKVDCIPGFAEIPVTADSVQLDPKTFLKFRRQVPDSRTGTAKFLRASAQSFDFSIELPHARDFQNIFLFPHDGERFRTAAPEMKIREDEVRFSTLVSANTRAKASDPARFTVVAHNSEGVAAFDIRVEPSADLPQFFWGLALAMVGGLLLNLMPCVFPVLFLKGYSFLKTENAALIRRSSWMYTAGVLFSFLIIGGALTALRVSGASIGWGFQLQNPILVALLGVLFFVMGLSFLGIINFDFLRVPSFLEQNVNKHLSGDFGTGILAVVVASPCTAPFMGAALGMTLLLPPQLSILIFLGIGLGLAAPIPIMAHWPWFIRKLPRSGPWMVTLKKLMALPLFATSLWLAWVLSTQVSEREVAANWNSYDAAVIAERRRQQPVFIDFTASWCITCQVNKSAVLDTAEIQSVFEKNNVYLVRADWTNHDSQITEALAQFRRNSVPLYVFYDKNSDSAVVLPELLTRNQIRNLFSTGEKK